MPFKHYCTTYSVHTSRVPPTNTTLIAQSCSFTMAYRVSHPETYLDVTFQLKRSCSAVSKVLGSERTGVIRGGNKGDHNQHRELAQQASDGGGGGSSTSQGIPHCPDCTHSTLINSAPGRKNEVWTGVPVTAAPPPLCVLWCCTGC